MLQFNPDNRITVDDALKHPYLDHLHCEEDEVLEFVLFMIFYFKKRVIFIIKFIKFNRKQLILSLQ